MRTITTLPIALLLAACAAVPAGPDLQGREFLSTGVEQAGADRPLVPGSRIRMTFSDGRISASAGCNTMSGAYRIDGGRILLDDLATTLIGCQADLQAQDEWLSDFFRADPAIRLDGNDLVLEEGDITISLLDREVAQPDLPLVGPTWVVDSIFAGDTVSSVPEGATATLTFNDAGQVSIETGCNAGSARYVAEPGVLRLSEVTTTLRLCEGAAGQLEAAVLAVLTSNAVTAHIDAGNLRLQAGDAGLGLIAR
jgi:heat shock protein HslJ